MNRIRIVPDLKLVLFLAAALASDGCARQPAPTPFRPPTVPPPTLIAPSATSAAAVTTLPATATSVPTAGACINNLTYVSDLTIPDDTVMTPGASMDKQWQVQNSGTCDWDATYKLKWVGGDTLGALQEQVLYPARAGAQATLRIIFTAPAADGSYESAWQAVGPDGNVFGDLIFIKIAVSSSPPTP